MSENTRPTRTRLDQLETDLAATRRVLGELVVIVAGMAGVDPQQVKLGEDGKAGVSVGRTVEQTKRAVYPH